MICERGQAKCAINKKGLPWKRREKWSRGPSSAALGPDLLTRFAKRGVSNWVGRCGGRKIDSRLNLHLELGKNNNQLKRQGQQAISGLRERRRLP